MTINPAPLAKLAEVSPPPTPEVEVDDFDLALLRALASDSRQSQRALARQSTGRTPRQVTGQVSLVSPRFDF